MYYIVYKYNTVFGYCKVSNMGGGWKVYGRMRESIVILVRSHHVIVIFHHGFKLRVRVSFLKVAG